ncbi:MAG: murein biosynthesis integral membrane protein MurJ [Elusimicrobia bacterium]|jgi:putative peptidoglycan lipid II flippase|nr:murein biosynthesis integral membrane protein MurJ [Elusimicrobiota bacterium]
MPDKLTENRATVVSKASSVSGATMISRIFGFVRDMVIANFFGATMAADAFFVAYKIPNLLRRLLGEGALSTSFIPVYTEYLTHKGEDEAKKLVQVTFGAFTILFVILTVLGIIFAPQIVSVIAFGFTDNPDKFRLTVLLTRIMFPFLMAIGLGAITLGILNSWRVFFIPAVAPSMLSISEILFIFAVTPFLDIPISGLAYGVLVGGFAQFIFQLVPILKKYGFSLPSINLKHPGLRKIGRLMLPAIIGLSIMQINSFVDTICATLLKSGSVTHLYYGNRLMQLPLALFGTAVATVTLPMMSENAAKKEYGHLKDTFSFSLRAISFLILPAAVGFILFGGPIIQMLFQRGEFLAKDTASTAWVLLFYSTGLIFYAGVKVAVSAFHSLQDTKTPVIVASAAMLINVGLNLTVVFVDKVQLIFSSGGLAFATAIASAINFFLLIIIFRKRMGLIGGKIVTHSVVKHLTASTVMGVALYRLAGISSGWTIYLRVPAVIIASGIIYILSSMVLRVPELDRLKEIFLKRQS